MLRDITNKLRAAMILNEFVRLIFGTLILVFGVMILTMQTLTFDIIIYTIIILLIVSSISSAIKWYIKKPRMLTKIILPILTLTTAIVFIFFNNLTLYLLTILFGLYLFMSSIIEFVSAFLVLKNQKGEFIFSLIPGIFYLTFSIIFITSKSYIVFKIIAIYLILLGITYILDFVNSIIPKGTKSKIKRKIRITLPIFLAMFIPHSILVDLNRFLKKEGSEIENRQDLANKKKNKKSDLEIFFHVADKGFNSIGHCDIEFEGEVISYGNYHEKSQNKLGMGPGVLIISNKDEYIPFCLKHNKTTIFSFGLSLSGEQKSKIKERIDEIKSIIYPWNVPYKEAILKNREIKENKYKDFASLLYKETNSKFYKFKKSKYKTYFVMKTNCVALVDDIVCKAGTDILGISGIISPGTFFDYLQTEYLKKNSIVISKDVYKNI